MRDLFFCEIFEVIGDGFITVAYVDCGNIVLVVCRRRELGNARDIDPSRLKEALDNERSTLGVVGVVAHESES